MKKLRTICSTGSPLSEEGFKFIYKKVKSNVHLASISGGTDIVSCFVLGNIYEPVIAGEIQNKGLGMDVDIFDDNGKPIKNKKGELVCKNAFPTSFNIAFGVFHMGPAEFIRFMDTSRCGKFTVSKKIAE